MENFIFFAQCLSFLMVIGSVVIIKKALKSADDSEQSLIRTEQRVAEEREILNAKINAKPQVKLDTVTQAVDISTHSVEKIHKTISDTSFNLIGAMSPVPQPSKAIHKAHDMTAKGIYGSIRRVNRLVGDLSKNLQNDIKSPKKDDQD